MIRLSCCLLLLAAGLLFYSLVMTWQELKYYLFGKTCNAEFLSSYVIDVADQRGRTHQVRLVNYRFMDNKILRHETARVEPSWLVPAGPTVAVQYIPGVRGRSRVDTNHDWMWVVVFIGCLILGSYEISNLWFSAHPQ